MLSNKTAFCAIARLAACVAAASFTVTLNPKQAFAVVQGTSSSLDRHTVRIVRGGIRCSGVAIARNLIVTAAHCGARGTVIGGGAHIAMAGASRSATLDDGRRVSVSGDAIIARLSRPLPASISPVSIGEGGGDSYTIAGYGTANESNRGAFGQLREARLVAAERFALVDPNRAGSIGASACFGDSGGPVLRGSQLVGIVTRAAHPHPRIACGHLTRWAPITIDGASTTALLSNETQDVPPKARRTRAAKSGNVKANSPGRDWFVRYWQWQAEGRARTKPVKFSTGRP